MSRNIVIIPTYKEIENIERMVHKVMSLEPAIDLLVVDDNSPDGTAQMVEKLQANYAGRLHILKRPGKNGLGTAYIAQMSSDIGFGTIASSATTNTSATSPSVNGMRRSF